MIFYTTYKETSIADLLSTAFESKTPLVVIDENNKFQGIIDREVIITEMNEGADESEAPTVFSEIVDEQTIENK